MKDLSTTVIAALLYLAKYSVTNSVHVYAFLCVVGDFDFYILIEFHLALFIIVKPLSHWKFISKFM